MAVMNRAILRISLAGTAASALILMTLSLAGCGGPHRGRLAGDDPGRLAPIEAVQRGFLALDVSRTVGEALNNYGGFVPGLGKWTFFEARKNRRVVQYAGVMDLRKANMSDASIGRLEEVLFIVQFGVNQDQTFEVRYLGYVIRPKERPVKEYHAQRPIHDDFLRCIYGNYKFPDSMYELLIESLVLK